MKPKAVCRACVFLPSSKRSVPLVEIVRDETEQEPVAHLIVKVLPGICEVGGRTRVPGLVLVFTSTRSAFVLRLVILLNHYEIKSKLRT